MFDKSRFELFAKNSHCPAVSYIFAYTFVIKYLCSKKTYFLKNNIIGQMILSDFAERQSTWKEWQ